MIRKMTCFAVAVVLVAGISINSGCNGPGEPVAGTATNASFGPSQTIDGETVHGGVTKVD